MYLIITAVSGNSAHDHKLEEKARRGKARKLPQRTSGHTST